MSTIKVTLADPSLKLPSKAHPTDTGFDLYVAEDVTIDYKPIAYKTGVRLIIPEGYWVRLAEKSGKALKGLRIHAGIVDESYRGEVMVVASMVPGVPCLYLKKGEAICQMILEKRHDVELQQIDEAEFSTNTIRGEGGFGSTGR